MSCHGNDGAELEEKPLNIHTSTSDCVGAMGILISRTAREKAREKGGERALEHG